MIKVTRNPEQIAALQRKLYFYEKTMQPENHEVKLGAGPAEPKARPVIRKK